MPAASDAEGRRLGYHLSWSPTPDLVLWHGAPPTLWCVEVKSATDRLRAAQVKMLDALSRLPNVRCTVCGPASALKRAADDLARGDGSGDETP